MGTVKKLRTKTLDELAYDLEVAKQGLLAARDAVRNAEEAILAAFPAPEEGSESRESQFYRITVTGKLNRTIDAEQLEKVQHMVPAAIFARVIKYKPSLSLRDYRYVEQNEPDVYRHFAHAITTKPEKSSVSVARLIED